IDLNCSISFSVCGEKGTSLPSKACRTIPSSRSPRVISFSSATALSTFNKRFSIRTPVWTRSTTTGSRFCCTCGTGSSLVHAYQSTTVIQPCQPPPGDFFAASWAAGFARPRLACYGQEGNLNESPIGTRGHVEALANPDTAVSGRSRPRIHYRQC